MWPILGIVLTWLGCIQFPSPLSPYLLYLHFLTEFNRWTGSDFLIVHLVAPFQEIKNPIVYFWIFRLAVQNKAKPSICCEIVMISAVCRHWGLSVLLQVFWKEYLSSGSFTPDIFYIHRFLSLPSFFRAKCPLAHQSPALWRYITDTQSKFSANLLHSSWLLTASDGLICWGLCNVPRYASWKVSA